MLYSVVWYSQRITRALGADRLTAYARAFGYGNADFSGDPGQDNGLERAWIASSLLVSPRDQARFLQALVTDSLPVSQAAMTQTRALVEGRRVEDWQMQGKTGGAYPRRADRSFDYARGWGWYVGWAERAGRQVVFVRLIQGREPSQTSPGLLARDAFLADWPALARRIASP
jgi:beta-lactamase class D